MAQWVVGSWRRPWGCVTGIHQFSFPHLCMCLEGVCAGCNCGHWPDSPSKHRNPPAKLGRHGFGYQKRQRKVHLPYASAGTTRKPSVCCSLGKTFLRMSTPFPALVKSGRNGLWVVLSGKHQSFHLRAKQDRTFPPERGAEPHTALGALVSPCDNSILVRFLGIVS